MSLIPYVHLDQPLSGANPGDVVALSSAERHHLTRVLRLERGASLVAADGRGTCASAVLGDEVLQVTGDVREFVRYRPRLCVAQSLGKGRRTDEAVRAVAELGVDTIVMVDAQRSIVRLDPAKAAATLSRWEAVSRAACEQSRQPHRPTVSGPVASRALGELPGELLIADPEGQPLLGVIDRVATSDLVTIAIGPEGGWTSEEIDGLTGKGTHLVSIGRPILRTEHAAAAAVAVLAAGLGRWAGSK